MVRAQNLAPEKGFLSAQSKDVKRVVGREFQGVYTLVF